VMTPFRQQFGKPSLRKPGKIAHFDRGTWRILLGTDDQCPERWRVPLLPLPLTSHRERSAEPGVLSSNMFAHMKKDLTVKSFRPVVLTELNDTAMRRRHEACAFLFELFSTALSHGQVFLSDECTFYRICPSRNVFGPNCISNTRMSWKTTQHA
jgi:hypothetical protein